MPERHIHPNTLEALGPATSAEAVTASNSTKFDTPTRGLFIGAAGNVTVTMASGQQVLFTGVLAGSFLPIRVIQVRATGTSASSIVRVW